MNVFQQPQCGSNSVEETVVRMVDSFLFPYLTIPFQVSVREGIIEAVVEGATVNWNRCSLGGADNQMLTTFLGGSFVEASEISPAGLFLTQTEYLKSTTCFYIQCTTPLSPQIFLTLTQDQIPSVGLLGPEEKIPFFLPFTAPPPLFWQESSYLLEKTLPPLLRQPLSFGLLPMLTHKLQETYVRHFEQLSRNSFIDLIYASTTTFKEILFLSIS